MNLSNDGLINENDLSIARDTLYTTDNSIVVVKNGEILLTKKGEGIRPLLETIEELKERMIGSIIGDRILGKASALLLRYSKVSGVYAPQATKTALAVLIIGGIPVQTDELIPFIQNKAKDGPCPFEKMLEGIESPEDAYSILKENILKKD